MAVICTLRDPTVPALAEKWEPRASPCNELWLDRLEGASTRSALRPPSLFRLLEMLDGGAPCPAADLGSPRFVGAAESKEALDRQLARHPLKSPYADEWAEVR